MYYYLYTRKIIQTKTEMPKCPDGLKCFSLDLLNSRERKKKKCLPSENIRSLCQLLAYLRYFSSIL